MCTSRYYLVRRPPEGGKVEVEDVSGQPATVSLLAWAADPPRPGDWIVVHSGYALEPADHEEAESAARLYRL